jgi:hypothetical protein
MSSASRGRKKMVLDERGGDTLDERERVVAILPAVFIA